MKITGTILSVNTAAEKGDKKRPVAEVIIKEGGVVGDAHFASEKEVSFLDWGSVEALIEKNRNAPYINILPGDFAENITTKGLDFKKTRVGAHINIYPSGNRAGEAVIFEITSIGKTCHGGCRIKQTLGDCAMPREGVFAKVIEGGGVRAGDTIELDRIKK